MNSKQTEVRKIGDGRIIYDGETYVNEKSSRVIPTSEFIKQSLPSKPVGDVEAQIDNFIEERIDFIEEWKGNEYQLLKKVADFVKDILTKSGYAAAPQKGMKELFNKLKREFEFVGDEKISGITALRLIKPIFDESPSPSEAAKVTRVEIIDEKGRSYVNWDSKNKVELQYQDNGQTLKVIIQKTVK